MFDDHDDDFLEEEISKSQQKREAQALKELGVQLIALDTKRLDALPLTDALRQAVIEARKLTSNGAKRRQAQLIGKLMRQADHEQIRQSLADMSQADQAQTAEFHQAERWREQLIKHDDALTTFIDQHQGIDIQQLRQLIRKAREDIAKSRNTGASRQLFRLIRTCYQPH